jgi:hypothetical protein
MKCCDKHWAAFRAGIEARGLTHLVAKSGEEALSNVMLDLLDDEEAPYDPLMQCNWMVMGQALKGGGLYLMGQRADGSDYCPVCEAMNNLSGVPPNGSPPGTPGVGAEWVENHWTNGVMDAVLAECRKRGLVPAPN